MALKCSSIVQHRTGPEINRHLTVKRTVAWYLGAQLYTFSVDDIYESINAQSTHLDGKPTRDQTFGILIKLLLGQTQDRCGDGRFGLEQQAYKSPIFLWERVATYKVRQTTPYRTLVFSHYELDLIATVSQTLITLAQARTLTFTPLDIFDIINAQIFFKREDVVNTPTYYLISETLIDFERANYRWQVAGQPYEMRALQGQLSPAEHPTDLQRKYGLKYVLSPSTH